MKKYQKMKVPNLLEDTVISTRTIIADVNVEFDIENIFKNVPLQIQLKNYPCSIVAMYNQNCKKGDLTVLQQHGTKSFRNAVNVIFRISDQLINIKVSRHGNFQITGAKHRENCYTVVMYFIDLCKEYSPQVMTNLLVPKLQVCFTTVMTNVVYNTNYKIDKRKLNDLIQNHPNFYCLYETNFGYTGMNIKLPLKENWENFTIPMFICGDHGWEKSAMSYQNYLHQRGRLKRHKKKFNTFLIFHSGKVIMSGMHEDSMRDDFLFFSQFLKDNQKSVEEIITN